ncbi:hypothetical protein WN51_09351 [Melipona quadrifasciata]|uniref:Uncharacterized protein n=1 Tax=Melipona quadrifasciata TaxID=166423 RepID=A0A0M9A6X0_9HYME|nr:hypothetical protein WN51_09351 [Melipona quadrifasciata]
MEKRITFIIGVGETIRGATIFFCREAQRASRVRSWNFARKVAQIASRGTASVIPRLSVRPTQEKQRRFARLPIIE